MKRVSLLVGYGDDRLNPALVSTYYIITALWGEKTLGSQGTRAVDLAAPIGY